MNVFVRKIKETERACFVNAYFDVSEERYRDIPLQLWIPKLFFKSENEIDLPNWFITKNFLVTKGVTPSTNEYSSDSIFSRYNKKDPEEILMNLFSSVDFQNRTKDFLQNPKNYELSSTILSAREMLYHDMIKCFKYKKFDQENMPPFFEKRDGSKFTENEITMFVDIAKGKIKGNENANFSGNLLIKFLESIIPVIGNYVGTHASFEPSSVYADDFLITDYKFEIPDTTGNFRSEKDPDKAKDFQRFIAYGRNSNNDYFSIKIGSTAIETALKIREACEKKCKISLIGRINYWSNRRENINGKEYICLYNYMKNVEVAE